MSSTGTRVLPTLTEVLDEQRLSKPHWNLSTEPWCETRPGDEELVPISLDWGDGPVADAAGEPPAGSEVQMTPWQRVQPRPASASDALPFIDLSIEVSAVQAPVLPEQVHEVYPTPPAAWEAGQNADGDMTSALAQDHSPGLEEAGRIGTAIAAAPARGLHQSEAAGLEQGSGLQLGAEAVLGEAPVNGPEDAPAMEGNGRMEEGLTGPLLAPLEAEQHQQSGLGTPATTPAPIAAAASRVPPVLDRFKGPAAQLDPGLRAVRQGSEHVPGISEERLQAILQQALDRLLRDELPSALVETLIRLSPQLTDALVESLKPSLHLHVMEALSAELPGSGEGRLPG